MATNYKVITIVLAFIWCKSQVATAQRGEQLEARPGLFTSPTQGYPGFFDTNMAEPETMVIEWPPIILPFTPLPTVALDYGVNERLTLGANALMTTLPWLVGVKSAALKARTLLHGTETTQSTATAYLGYFGGGKTFNMYWQLLTSNNAWKVAPNHILSANAAFINFGLVSGDLKSTNYNNIQITTASIGAGHQYIWTEDKSFSTYIMLPAWSSIKIDSATAALDVDTDASSGDAMWGLARLSLDVRSEPWLYSFGLAYSHGNAKELLPKTSGLLPWFSATRKY